MNWVRRQIVRDQLQLMGEVTHRVQAFPLPDGERWADALLPLTDQLLWELHELEGGPPASLDSAAPVMIGGAEFTLEAATVLLAGWIRRWQQHRGRFPELGEILGGGETAWASEPIARAALERARMWTIKGEASCHEI